jgi:hypothetical protein
MLGIWDIRRWRSCPRALFGFAQTALGQKEQAIFVNDEGAQRQQSAAARATPHHKQHPPALVKMGTIQNCLEELEPGLDSGLIMRGYSSLLNATNTPTLAWNRFVVEYLSDQPLPSCNPSFA